ncbi:MAG: hypothetical protein GY710_17510 [Desulfobacteraceae bacterium]|nr:hypothetical protein [Desulfobacteraceae bacterium]
MNAPEILEKMGTARPREVVKYDVWKDIIQNIKLSSKTTLTDSPELRRCLRRYVPNLKSKPLAYNWALLELKQLEKADVYYNRTGEQIFGQWLTRKFKKISSEKSLLKLKTFPNQIQVIISEEEIVSSRIIADKISKMALYEPAASPPSCFNEITKELNTYLKGDSGLTGRVNMFPVLGKVVKKIGYFNFKGFSDGQKLFLEIAGRKLQEVHMSGSQETFARDIVRYFNGSIAFWLFWNIKLGLSKVAEECSSSLGLSEIKKQYSERLKKLDSLLNSKKVLIVNGETHKRTIYDNSSSLSDKKVAKACNQLYRYTLESARCQQLTCFVEGLIAEVPVFDYVNPKRRLPNICGLEEETTYGVGLGYLDSFAPPKDLKTEFWKAKTMVYPSTSSSLLPPNNKQKSELISTKSRLICLDRGLVKKISISPTKNPYALKALETFLDIFDVKRGSPFNESRKFRADQTGRNQRIIDAIYVNIRVSKVFIKFLKIVRDTSKMI